jgi:hypothetical protein
MGENGVYVLVGTAVMELGVISLLRVEGNAAESYR